MDEEAIDQADTERTGEGPRLIAYRVNDALPARLVRAPVKRSWIDATSDRFAASCLPVMIANQAGWMVLNSHPLRVTWNGGRKLESVSVEYLGGDPPYPASSHFGEGILTFHVPYLFRTPPGWNLLARGPANLPKAGVSPLEGLIETDWAVSTFTMNWQLTAIDQPVTFEVGEPICMIVPQRRYELESFHPEIRQLAGNPEEFERYKTWSTSRSQFNAELAVPGSPANIQKRQRHYIRGRSPDGTEAPQHQTNLKLRAFFDPDGICPPDSEPEVEQEPDMMWSPPA